MFLAAIDPNLPKFVLVGIIIIVLGLILRYFKQPYVIAYILAGVLLGKYGFQLVTDTNVINSMGEFGLILLLFFIGMEISLPDLVKNWKLPLVGTIIQVSASVGIVAAIGFWFDWQWNRIVMLGFIIALSSSAVVIKLLQDAGETKTAIGKSVISILLMQDILIVPMLIIVGYLGGNQPSTSEIIMQIFGGALIIFLLIWIIKKRKIVLPFGKTLKHDHELQVFLALIICFGSAVITALFGLSGALGAFVGGIYVHATKSTKWFHKSLHSFRVMFVALFFVSVGMLIDLNFLMENKLTILMLLGAIYMSNHFINAVILHLFGSNWRDSLYGGALLAQIGELSFVLAATGSYLQIISDYVYQLSILSISLSLLMSPFWIGATKKWTKHTIQLNQK